MSTLEREDIRPSWWDAIDRLPPEQQAAVLEQLRPRIRLRYTTLTPTPKQAVFLALQNDEAFYGGAAGPGKSTALMLAALQYVDVPGYSALLLRRTYGELAEAGALIDMSHEMLDDTDAIWNENRKRWLFPSGAILKFGYLAREAQKSRYQGARYHFVGWDELTGFTETMYEYLFSRQRRPATAPGMGRSLDGLTSADVPLRMRSASNPGGEGHEWVYDRFVNPETRLETAIYVPAKLQENPHLDQVTYVKSLMHLRGAERQRLLAGDWEARDDGEYFNRETWPRHEVWNRGTRAVRRWDLAATVKSARNTDPDWTVGLRYELDHRSGEYCVVDVIRVRETPGKVKEIIRQTAEDDGRVCHISMEQEPGSSGKAVIDDYRRKVLRGYVFRSNPSTGNKEVRAKPVSAAAEPVTDEGKGLVGYLVGDWVRAFFAELESFPVGHDDQVDALSGAHEYLSKAGPATIKATKRRITLATPQARVPRIR